MNLKPMCAAAAMAAFVGLSPAGLQAQRPGGAQTTPSQAGQPANQPGSQPGGMSNPRMQPSEMPNQTPQTDSGSNKMMHSPDAKFAMKAAQGGMAEVQLGQLATQKAGNPGVKAFGQMMVDDHSKANDQLKSVAGQEKMQLPTTLDAKDQSLFTKLQGMSGPEFDKTYIKAMVKDHQQDVKEFQKEADKGKDPQIKNFASQTLPVLQQHLSKAQQLEGSAGSAGASGGGASGGAAGGSGTGTTTGPQ